jgi:F-type H+-transporting ATPase subunit gamma
LVDAATLHARIERLDGLRDVVNLMRVIAVAHLRHAEEQLMVTREASYVVLAALADVEAELGLAIPQRATGASLILCITSQQGMCGRYNEVMIERLLRWLDDRPAALVAVIGARGAALARLRGIPLVHQADAPASPAAIDRHVRLLASAIERLTSQHGLREIQLLHAVHRSIGRFEDHLTQLLPFNTHSIEDLPPARHSPPRRHLALGQLHPALLNEVLVLTLHRALTEALAAENSSRLQSMESARTHIDERREALLQRWRSARQQQVTAELLDLVGGTEALR